MRLLQPVPPRHAIVGMALLLTISACAGNAGDQAAGDTTAATVTAAPADTGMAGMDHSNMPGMNRSAPRDSNQVLLRMMSDHHEGLVAMADSAEERASSEAAKADARQLKTKQDREQQEMLGMLSAQYQDSVTPMIMPSNQVMLDSTLNAQGASFDPTFYRQVINHHREGIMMAERLMPHLTGEVRRMTERMVAEQRREIEDFERKT